MGGRRIAGLLTGLGLLAAAGLISGAGGDSLPLEKIKLPPGFRIGLYARVPHARSMALAPGGTLFVGTRENHVYAVRKGKTAAEGGEVVTVASGLDTPNGVAIREGALYVAEIARILRFGDIEARLGNPPKPVVLRDDFPKDTHHGWKFIAFGPDGWLYVPVGAPCNICESKEPVYAAIHRMRADGSAVELFASGVRNTVGFDWDPGTKQLWFTDNGRDMLGDEVPPDELNHAPRAGMHFGYPYCHGGDIADPEFGKKRPCSEFTAPAMRLGPHVASLGMRFYTGASFPPEYRNQIFIAEHGSWNRSSKIGYRVSLVRREGDKAVRYETFAQGWLQGERAWGRPVDLQVTPDGSLLVSDDEAGAIYRISYGS